MSAESLLIFVGCFLPEAFLEDDLQRLTRQFIVTVIISVSLLGQALAQYPQLEFSRHHRAFVSENRTTKELANPFKNPNIFHDANEVNSFVSNIKDTSFNYVHNEESSIVEVYRKDNSEQAVAYIPVMRRDHLLEYKPSRLQERIKQTAKQMSAAAKSGVRHTTMNLPIEATIFYMAIGSVVAFNMVTQFANNPAGLALFHEQQASAVGITSLFMFLAAQNATSNVASIFITNPRWHVMLPYLGMIVGAMAQNYSASLMTDPNIKACVNEWMGKSPDPELQNPCDKAYEYFTLQKPWDYAPGITSMLISAGIAGSAQFAVSSAALAAEKQLAKGALAAGRSQALRQATRISLIRIAGFINPGAVPFMTVTGIWLYLTKASNLALFAHLDHQIVHGITFAVKNLQESARLPVVKTIAKSQDQLTTLLSNRIDTKWNETTSNNFGIKPSQFDRSGMTTLVGTLSEQMKMWRMANIAKVTESHASWQRYLGDLVNRYKASEAFYGRVIDEILKARSGAKSQETSIYRLSPLWGINAKTVGKVDETYLAAPHLVESEQIEKALEVIKQAIEMFSQRVQRSRVTTGEDAELLKHLELLINRNNGNTTNEQLMIARALQLVEKWLQEQEVRGKTMYTDYGPLKNAVLSLGKLEPKIYTNAWLLAAVDKSPRFQNFSSKVDLSSEKKFGQNHHQKYSDILIWRMICGRDASDQKTTAIEESWGFKARFNPPRVVDWSIEKDLFEATCDDYFNSRLNRIQVAHTDLTRIPLAKLNPTELMKVPSPLGRLNQDLLPEISKNGFEKWWNDSTEISVKNAFSDFQDKYVTIIESLLTAMKRKDNSAWNISDIASNGILMNLRQEMRLYLMILNSVIQSEGIRQGHYGGLKTLAIVPKQNHELMSNVAPQRPIPILKAQAHGSYLSFPELVRMYPTTVSTPAVLSRPTLSFQHEQEIEKVFSKMESLLNEFNVSVIGGKKQVIGPKIGTKLDEQITELENILEKVSSATGTAKAKEASAADLFRVPDVNTPKPVAEQTQSVTLLMNDSQKELIVKLLEQIQGLAFEIRSYSMVINAVNWNEMNNKEVDEKTAEQHRRNMNKILNDFNKGSLVGGS